MEQDPCKSLVIAGTGAMACLFAARLSAAGMQISMLGTWKAGLQALRQDGVRLVEQDGREAAYPVQVIDDPPACNSFEYALVLVKSWQTERAARQLAQCLSADGLALTLQNGLGNREILAKLLGEPRTALGTTTTGAHLLAPGRVKMAGDGAITLSHHERLEPMAQIFRSAGFAVETVPDASILLWGKLVINAAINPLTAILGVPNGALLELPPARSLLAATAYEAASVAFAKGIRLPYPDPVIAAENVARRTAKNHSSMLQDIQRGGLTEIDAICGAIVRLGEDTSVPTPINRTLWLIVKALEKTQGIKS